MERQSREIKAGLEEEQNKQRKEHEEQQEQELHSPNISTMKPTTKNAYGGGMYAQEKDGGGVERERTSADMPASQAQSADGPGEAATYMQPPKHKPPPSSGDRDIDITGQSYIQ